jgi:hypothetical protein
LQVCARVLEHVARQYVTGLLSAHKGSYPAPSASVPQSSNSAAVNPHTHAVEMAIESLGALFQPFLEPFVSICMYVRMHVCTSACTYICMHACICVCVMHVHVCVCVCVCVYVGVYVGVYVCVAVHTQTLAAYAHTYWN